MTLDFIKVLIEYYIYLTDGMNFISYYLYYVVLLKNRYK